MTKQECACGKTHESREIMKKCIKKMRGRQQREGKNQDRNQDKQN